ncbi:MAG: tetratricopeptide repeat protein, partial [Gammaproteobacteria bacterium]|nr:tetratricopeptide repeat protein [Gammaproteobacteria bacterium]
MKNTLFLGKVFVLTAASFMGLLIATETLAQEPLNLVDMEALIRAGQAEEAYAMMKPFRYERAGDPEFDYLMGLAALQSGRPAEATLALERVLAVKPDMLGARLDMARAYFELGNYDLARQEFEELQKLDPPPDARKAMKNFLAAIERETSPSRFTAFAEATIGHDSNVNNAGSDSVFIPALDGTVTLSASSIKSPDWYAQGRIGGQVTHKLDRTWSSYGSGDIRIRTHDHEDIFDVKEGTISGGVRKTMGKHTLAAGLSYNKNSLDGKNYRTTFGINGQLTYALNKRNQAGAFIQHNAIRYLDDTDDSEDSDLTLTGISWTGALDGNAKTIVSVGGFIGFDNALNDRIDGSRNIAGSRIAAQHQINDHLTLYGSVGVQQSEFRMINTLFLKKRRDNQFDATLGLDWKYLQNWKLSPRLSYTKNHSNIEIDK